MTVNFQAWLELVAPLARAAVDLVIHDLQATTDARPVVEIRQDLEYG